MDTEIIWQGRLERGRRMSAPSVTRLAELWRPTRLTLVAGLACAIWAGIVAWAIETRLTELMLAQVAARAGDQVQLVIVPHVTAADFEPPLTSARLEALTARLDPLLDRARQEGSGILRLNLFARDGTIIYSDLASLRGRTVSPLGNQQLAAALAGQPGTEISSLTELENGDLHDRYGSALEAYVPFVLDGRIVGAYELYQDPNLVRPIRPLVWTSVTAGFAVLLVVLQTVVLRHFGPSQAPAGGSPLPRPGRTAGAPRLPVADTTPANYLLTRRELEVLRLLATGCTYRELANQLVVDEETVRSHVKSILRKLGQPDRVQAVAAAREAGFL